jgi:predicted nucleic acid-binding protein
VEYLADTVAIVRHLRAHPAQGPRAAEILSAADLGQHHVYLSAITLVEVLYLSEARRIDVGLSGLVDRVSGSANYEIVPVGVDAVLAAADVDDVPELHDRVIAGTARWLGVPILTGDEVIGRSRHVQTIW